MRRTIFFSVGEPSADQHVARLITALHAQNPSLRMRGLGGPRMRAAGCRLDEDLTRMAVMGLVEVLPKLRDFFRLADQAEAVFRAGEVDAVVLADFPGFNWHIAKRAKRYGLPVYYYLPPQLWAWGGWRVKKMRRYVDTVLSVLPLEDQWYRDSGVDSRLVGHPFFDAVAQQRLDPAVMDRLTQRRRAGRRLVAVLPGSRQHEVHRNWPLQLEAIRRLSQSHPDAEFLVAAFRDAHCLWCREQLSAADARLPIRFYAGKTSEVIEAAECGLMVSGSVSLEMMARDTPAAVVYRVGRIFHTAARTLATIPSFTLPNLLAGRPLFPEFPSVGRPEGAIAGMTAAVDRMLGDSEYRAALGGELAELRRRYARPGASQRAAVTLLECLQWPRHQTDSAAAA